MTCTRTRNLGCLLSALLAFGCEEEVVGGPPPNTVTAANAAAIAETAPDAAATVEEELQDDDFVESDSNRDPFRTFAQTFVSRPSAQSVQRDVVMPRTSLEAMRLIAVVGGAEPRAMLVDETGMGYTVRRGDYLGRAEIIQTGGPEGVPLTLNWRVERIRASQADRPAEVVLSREDPTSPSRAPIMRVVALVDSDSTR